MIFSKFIVHCLWFGFVENRTNPVKTWRRFWESVHTKSLTDLMQDVWISYMNFVTSPCHDVSPKGKDSSVGESPPTLRFKMALFQGVWMLLKHYSWLRRYCSAWCHFFFGGPGTFSKSGPLRWMCWFQNFQTPPALSALDWWEWPVVCWFLQQFAWGMASCGWCLSDRITDKVLRFSKALEVFCESGYTNVMDCNGGFFVAYSITYTKEGFT